MTEQKIHDEQQRVRRVFTGVALAIMLGALEITLLMPAISTLGREFSASAQAPLLVSSYLFAMTLSMPLYGRLSDRFGRRPCLAMALALFTLGSLASSLMNTLPALLATRLLTGAGGGGLIALSFAVIADVIPPRQVGRYQGYISAIFAISSVAGPLLGAVIIGLFDWRWLFVFKVPLGLLALGLNHWALKGLGHEGTQSRQDFLGIGLLLLCGIGWGLATHGEIVQPVLADWSLPLMTASGVLSMLLLWHQWRHPDPVLPLRFLCQKLFAIAVLLLALSEAIRLALLVYVPLALEQRLNMTPEQTGIVLLWFILSVTAGTFISGKRISGQGYCRPFPWLGGLAMAAGSLGLGWVLHWPRPDAWLYPALIGTGVGIGFLIVSCSIAVQNALPARQLGSGLALMNFIRSLGGTLGVSLLGWQYQQGGSGDWIVPVFLWVAGYALCCLLLGWLMPDARLSESAKNG
ncbi:MFS transporter [Zobellella taiwanensis]|uniref:MFS transporter n=1 Tax=Zobellella taiwanensis TaxID=347535 RepID=A0A2P7R240_9GAMM|nr:MFS transporter [Zobellella taiwanensis]PSJ44272.1 MFS transporter [Zobellella taiwanensis]